MVKNLVELQEESAKWSQMAITDLKKQMEMFMNTHNANVEKVAELLGWKPKKVQAILDGIGDIRISDLATLLIATNQVLQILPAKETPIHFGSLPDEVNTEDENESDIPEWDREDEKEEPKRKEEEPTQINGGIIGIDLSNNPDLLNLFNNISKMFKESGLIDLFSKGLKK